MISGTSQDWPADMTSGPPGFDPVRHFFGVTRLDQDRYSDALRGHDDLDATAELVAYLAKSDVIDPATERTYRCALRLLDAHGLDPIGLALQRAGLPTDRDWTSAELREAGVTVTPAWRHAWQWRLRGRILQLLLDHPDRIVSMSPLWLTSDEDDEDGGVRAAIRAADGLDETNETLDDAVIALVEETRIYPAAGAVASPGGIRLRQGVGAGPGVRAEDLAGSWTWSADRADWIMAPRYRPAAPLDALTQREALGELLAHLAAHAVRCHDTTASDLVRLRRIGHRRRPKGAWEARASSLAVAEAVEAAVLPLIVPGTLSAVQEGQLEDILADLCRASPLPYPTRQDALREMLRRGLLKLHDDLLPHDQVVAHLQQLRRWPYRPARGAAAHLPPLKPAKRKPKASANRLRTFGEVDLDRLADALKGSRFALPVALAVRAGIRPAELATGVEISRAGDDWVTISVRGAKVSRGSDWRADSGIHARVATWNLSGMGALRLIIEHALDDASLPRGPGGGRLVRMPAAVAGLTPALQRACRAAKLPQVSVYDLRHALAAKLKAEGWAEPAVQGVLGHVAPQTQGQYGDPRRKWPPSGLISVVAPDGAVISEPAATRTAFTRPETGPGITAAHP